MIRSAESSDRGPQDPGSIDSDRPTILVVEDDVDLRHSLVTWLQESRNYKVLPAKDGEEARHWAEREDLRIDVAVIDLVLPDAFGSQVGFEQAFVRPDIKLIFISGHVPDDEVLAATVKDPNAVFLQKPFDLEDLGRAIDEALEGEDGTAGEGGSAGEGGASEEGGAGEDSTAEEGSGPEVGGSAE